MEMKLLIEVNQTWQADAITNALHESGIAFEVLQKAKEYSSIISGIDSISIDILVDEEKYIQASELLKKISSHSTNETVEMPIEKNYFRRVVIFSVIGVILLPLIFNLVATVNFIHLKQQNVVASKKWFAGFILIMGWVLACIMLICLIHH